jgi:hypothetical protein
MTKQVEYIGNGTQNEQFDGVVDVVIHMDDAEKFIYEYEGKRYLKIQVSQRKKADQFGHTHSVSHFTPKAKLEQASDKPKKGKKK